MDIREEVPIKSFSIAAYVCRVASGQGLYLMVKRSTPYLNETWQMVSGKIEKGEKAWQAALREIKEETGLVPDRLYSANEVELFYEVSQNCINIVPIFVGFIDTPQRVELSTEHSEYKWATREEAETLLTFDQQKKTIGIIEDKFVRQKPIEFLKITTR
jgi:dihydroneopterin triphosphate diphosphatase